MKTFQNLLTLATAVDSDKSTVSFIQTSNTDTQTKITDVIQRLELVNNNITQIQTEMKKLKYGGRTPRIPNNPRTSRRYTNNNYCWTHGKNIHEYRTSLTWRFSKNDHQRNATKIPLKEVTKSFEI